MLKRIEIVQMDGYVYGYELKKFGRRKKLCYYPQGSPITYTNDTKEGFIEWYVYDYLKSNFLYTKVIVTMQEYYSNNK